MRPRVLLLAVLATAAALAQNTGVPATVEGRVTNSVTGEGIANATVRLTPMGGMRNPAGRNDQTKELQASTQADGSFHIDQIVPGSYIIVPAREGFSLLMKSSVNRFVDLHDGQLVNGLVIQMIPNVTLTGTVIDNDGKPVPNAKVVALLPSMYGTQSSFDQRGSANCDKNGAFALKGLARGHYYLAAMFEPPKQPASASPDKAAQTAENAAAPGLGPFVPTFYPRSLNIADATAVVADPEQGSGNLTIYLQRAATHAVKGKVSELAQGGNLTVQLTPREMAVNSDLFAPLADIAADRTFVFSNVLPGPYRLLLMDRRSRRLYAREDIDVGATDVTGLVLNPLPPIQIRGTVTFENSGSMPTSPTATIMARPLDDQVRAGTQTVQSSADGSFSFKRLDPGIYTFHVLIRGSGSFYLQSVSLNGQDVTTRAVDLSQTGSGQMDVRLATGAGEVDGSVDDSTDANAGGHLWTLLVPQEIAPDASNVRVAVVKSDGTFAFPNVPPGNYQILAADQADPRIWQNPKFLVQIRNQGSSLTLEQSGHQQVQLHKVPFPVLQQTAEQLGIMLQ